MAMTASCILAVAALIMFLLGPTGKVPVWVGGVVLSLAEVLHCLPR